MQHFAPGPTLQPKPTPKSDDTEVKILAAFGASDSRLLMRQTPKRRTRNESLSSCTLPRSMQISPP